MSKKVLILCVTNQNISEKGVVQFGTKKKKKMKERLYSIH